MWESVQKNDAIFVHIISVEIDFSASPVFCAMNAKNRSLMTELFRIPHISTTKVLPLEIVELYVLTDFVPLALFLWLVVYRICRQ